MPFDFAATFSRALDYRRFLERYGTAEQRTRWQQVYDAVKLTEAQRALVQSFRRRMPMICLSGPWCGDCVNGCPVLQRIAEANPLIDLRFVNRPQQFDGSKPVVQVEEDDIRAKPIGKILVKWGILTPERVEKALLAQEERKSQGLNARIGDVMTDLGLISAAQRDEALAHQAGYESLEEADREFAMEVSVCGAPRVPVVLFLSEDGYECGRFGERTISTYRAKALGQLHAAAGPSCPTGLIAPPADLLAAATAEWLEQIERIQWMLLTSPRLMKLHGEV
jgi:hypothetical protein